MKIEAVIFDMDGLMIDSEKVYSDSSYQAAVDIGYEPSEELALKTKGVNNEAWRAMVTEFYGDGFPMDRFEKRCAELMEQHYIKNGIPKKPGLTELLEYLKEEKIPCAVASSTDTAKAMRMLQDAEVDSYFAAFVFGDMVERSKPQPDIFLAAAKALGKEPEQCMGLEDSRNGLTASKAAGLYTVMVPDMIEPDGALISMIDNCVPSLHHIIPLLEKLNA